MFAPRGDRLRSFRAALCLAIGSLLASSPTCAQDFPETNPAATTQGKQSFAFEVVSVRRHQPGAPEIGVQLTRDGFRASLQLSDMILSAYNLRHEYWSVSKFQNAPSWINDLYDIDGRVAPADLPLWQASIKSNGLLDPEGASLLRSAFRTILADRFHLAMHEIPTQVPYLDLLVGKHGAKLTPSVPGTLRPANLTTRDLGDGFYIKNAEDRRFIGVTLEDFARFLTDLSPDLPVQDKTGLAGRYDFTLPWFDYQQHPASDFPSDLERIPLERSGLVLKRGKGHAYLFVIDHIQQPDEN